MISPEPWNGLPPRYPHLEALVAGFSTIYICPLNSDQRLCCYALTRVYLHYYQYSDYISWSVERILIALDAFESPRFTLFDDIHVYGILLVEATIIPWRRYCCILASCDARYIWFLHCQMILWLNSLMSNWSCRHYHCIQDQKKIILSMYQFPLHTSISTVCGQSIPPSGILICPHDRPSITSPHSPTH